jgi:hypothetical protein
MFQRVSIHAPVKEATAWPRSACCGSVIRPAIFERRLTVKRPKRVKNIPIDQIRFLNPRLGNRRNFQEMVQSIANVGLKRPITVSPRKSEEDSVSYDLVCGQGRIEAFIQLSQTEIPVIVIEAEESDCLVMSLVENCARRQHRAIDLLQDTRGDAVEVAHGTAFVTTTYAPAPDIARLMIAWVFVE